MSKLFCDCKTDEEKSNFFLSGQGVETGIIAPAISNEVAMAFHRCFEFEKQLATSQKQMAMLRDALEHYTIGGSNYSKMAIEALAATADLKEQGK